MKQRPSVRPARRADASAVAAIARVRPTSAGWTRAQLEDEVDRNTAGFLVVDDDGEVVGYAIFRVVLDEAQIVDVAVREDREGRGIARALVAALAGDAARRGCARATLEVRSDNARAQKLYTASGFRVVGRRPKFYNDGADAVLMDRHLP